MELAFNGFNQVFFAGIQFICPARLKRRHDDVAVDLQMLSQPNLRAHTLPNIGFAITCEPEINPWPIVPCPRISQSNEKSKSVVRNHKFEKAILYRDTAPAITIGGSNWGSSHGVIHGRNPAGTSFDIRELPMLIGQVGFAILAPNRMLCH